MAHDFRTLLCQVIGKQNIFGYCNTIINQAHLMFWFLGEFYTSKIFNKPIVIFWISFNILAIFLLFYHSLSYILLTSNLLLSYTLFASEAILSTIYLLIMVPLGSYLYCHHVVEAFKILDQSNNLELKSISQPYHITDKNIEIIFRKKYSLKIAYGTLAFQVCLFCIYLTTTFLDLLVGYTRDKLHDAKYYVFPTYCENVNIPSTFLILLFSQLICGIPVGSIYFFNPFFPVIVMREFYCKFQSLSNFLDYRSKLFEFYYEKLLYQKYHNAEAVYRLQKSFLQDIHLAAKFHHDLLRGISHLRSYMEYNMTISLFIVLWIDIILIYIFTLMEEESVLLKIKILGHALVTGTVFFVYCLIGKLYDDMGQMFADSVYNSAWYYLPNSSRKSVFLLFYQAQVTIEFKAMKVYPLNMEFFLRWCNYLYSIVNLLRRDTVGRHKI